MNGWEVVIGIETHAQLRTKSKMFSGASVAFGGPWRKVPRGEWH